MHQSAALHPAAATIIKYFGPEDPYNRKKASCCPPQEGIDRNWPDCRHQQFAAYVRSDTARWAKAVADSGAKVD